MVHVVCMINIESDRATFTWSEGPASFEPYKLEGMVYKDFKEIAAEAREKLANLVQDYLIDEQAMPKSAFELAEAGFELYQAMFKPGAEQSRQAKQVRKWLEKLAQQQEVDTLEIVVESPWSLPWNIVYDQPPNEAVFLANDDSPDRWMPFWGLRYNLAGGRKVDPLRRMPLLHDPKVLLVVDSEIRDGLPEEQQKRLADFVERHNLKIVQSKTELRDAITAQRPDLLYWLSHASTDGLVLAGESISPRDMRKLLRQDDDENFGGLAFLNACQTAEGGEGGSFFEAFHNVGFAGMIGTEHQTVDQFANPLGLDFLEAFLDRGEPVGTVLRKLRGSVPLGLLYGTYCPPDIRVERGNIPNNFEIHKIHVQGVALSASLSPDSQTRTQLPLPDEPYPSLAYYERKDRALFAGRDDDIERFAKMLDEASTRILVLHGESGVGKSSFLHAGVIPYLEEECLGYRFMRNRQANESAGSQGSVIFVRATNDLFGQLAQALCVFCAQPYEYQTPLGETISANLPGVLSQFVGGIVNQAAVQAWLQSDPTALGQLMAAISNCLPFTAILVIDQGEELFTLAQKAEDQQRGRHALDMLRRTIGASGDHKVIFALRTEYYGRVIDRLRHGIHDSGSVREYLLTDFDEESLVEAIRRPTSVERIPYAVDVPFEKYGFGYGRGVAEEVAKRVVRYTVQRRDSVLPLMQVICSQLNRLARQRVDKIITLADLESIGGIEGGIRNHVESLLGQLLKGRPLDKRPVQTLFTQLYLKQADGTLTTALLAEDEVRKRWTGRMPFDELLESCNKLRLLKVNSLRIGMEDERRYVSLGHDALAKIAADWDEQLSRSARLRKWTAAIGVVTLVALAMAFLAFRATVAKQEAIKNELKAGIAQEEAEKSERKALENLALAQANERESRAREFAARAIPFLENKREPQVALQWAMGAVTARQPPIVDATTALYGAVQANHLKTKMPHAAKVLAMSWNPDGNLLATAASDQRIRIWNRDGTQVFSFEIPGRLDEYSIAWSPDGKILASVALNEGIPRFWDRKGNLLVELKEDPRPVSEMKWSPSGLHLATLDRASEDNKPFAIVRIWDREGHPIAGLSGHLGSTDKFNWSTDGTMLATVSRDKTARIWDTNGKTVHVLEGHTDAIEHVTWNPAKPIIATGSKDGTVRLWDVQEGQLIKELPLHKNAITKLAFNSTGPRLIVVASDSNQETGDTRLLTFEGESVANHVSKIDRLDGQTIFANFRARIDNVVWSPDGTKFMTLSSKQADLWTSDGIQLASFGGDETPVTELSWSPDSSLLATAGNESTIRVWDALGHRVAVIEGQTRSRSRNRLIAWSPDSAVLATNGEADVRVWDPHEHPMKTLRGYLQPIRFAYWQPYGNILATASSPTKTSYTYAAGTYDHLKLWGPNGIPLKTVDTVGTIGGMAWNTDGTAFAVDVFAEMTILDTTGTVRAILPGVSKWAWSPRDAIIASISISSSKQIRSPSKVGLVRLFDANGRRIAELSVRASRLVWSPDGSMLATESPIDSHPETESMADAIDHGNSRIVLFDKKGRPISELEGSQGQTGRLAWSPNSEVLAAEISTIMISKVLLWSATGTPLGTLNGLTSEIDNLSWSPDSNILVSASQIWETGTDGKKSRFSRRPIETSFQCWDPKGNRISEQRRAPGAIDTISWSPDSQAWVTVSSSWEPSKNYFSNPTVKNTLRFWSRDGRSTGKYEGNVGLLAWQPSGSVLATASEHDESIRLWNANGKLLYTLKGHEQGIRAISWSPDGATLASSSSDNTVRLWDESGKPLTTLADPKWSSFPVALRISSASFTSGGREPEDYILEWSPDGSQLASTMNGTTVRLWVTGVQELFWEAAEKRVGSESVIPPGLDAPAWNPLDLDLLASQLLDADPRHRLATVAVLGKLVAKQKDAVPLLLAALDDTSPFVRRKAVEGLGRLPSTSAEVVDKLAKALKDDSLLVRRRAIWAIGESGPHGSSAIASLFDSVADYRTEVEAVTAMGKLATYNATPLLTALENQNAIIRRALMALQESKNPEAASAFTKALSDPDDGVRIEAAIALFALTEDSMTVFPTAIILLRSEDPQVRLRAVGLLRGTNSKDREAIQGLGPLLLDENLEIQRQAMQALAQIGEASAEVSAELMLAIARDGLCDMSAVMELFHALGSAAPRILVPLRAAKSSIVRYRSESLLKSLGYKLSEADIMTVVGELRNMESNEFNELWAIRELVEELGDRALTAVESLLDSADFADRLWSVQVFSIINPSTAARTKLYKLMDDQNSLVRIHSAKTLWKNEDRDPRLLATLVDAVQSSNLDVRIRALELAAIMGPAAEEALPAIEKLFDDPNKQVQTSARNASELIRPSEQKRQ